MLVRICHFTEKTWLREPVLKACHGTNFLSVSVLFISFFSMHNSLTRYWQNVKYFGIFIQTSLLKLSAWFFRSWVMAWGQGEEFAFGSGGGEDTLKMCMCVYTKQFVRRETHTWCLYKRNTRCLEVTHMLCVLFNKNALLIMSVHWKVSWF